MCLDRCFNRQNTTSLGGYSCSPHERAPIVFDTTKIKIKKNLLAFINRRGYPPPFPRQPHPHPHPDLFSQPLCLRTQTTCMALRQWFRSKPSLRRQRKMIVSLLQDTFKLGFFPFERDPAKPSSHSQDYNKNAFFFTAQNNSSNYFVSSQLSSSRKR